MRKIIMTTTPSLEGYAIDRYLGVVSSRFVIGTGLFTEIFSSWTDFFGAHSRSYQGKLDKINSEALDRLRERAVAAGANAVVGLRVDHDEIAGGGKSMLMVTASGTAVIARRAQERTLNSGVAFSRAVSGEELSTLYRRDVLLANLAGGQRTLMDDEWEFLTEQQVAHAAKYVLENVEYTWKTSIGPLDHVMAKALAYFLAIPADLAKPLLYEAAIGSGLPAEFARDVIIKGRLLDLPALKELFRTRTRSERIAALQLMSAHQPVYTMADADAMEDLMDAIRNAFAEVPITEERGGLLTRGTRQIWECECGAKSDASAEQCRSCERDRYGVPSGWINPTNALSLLKWRISVVREQLRAPSGLETKQTSSFSD